MRRTHRASVYLRRAIGAVVYPACDVPEPGLIRHIENDRFTLGEPEPPTIVVDYQADVIGVVERRRAPFERSVVEVPAR